MQPLIDRIIAQRFHLLAGVLVIGIVIVGLQFMLQRTAHDTFVLEFNGQDTLATAPDLFISADSLAQADLAEPETDSLGTFRRWPHQVLQLVLKPNYYLPSVQQLSVRLDAATSEAITLQLPCRSCITPPPVLSLFFPDFDRYTIAETLPDAARLYATTKLESTTKTESQTLETWLLQHLRDQGALVTPEIWEQLRLEQLVAPISPTAAEPLQVYPGVFDLPQTFYIPIAAESGLELQASLTAPYDASGEAIIAVYDLNHQMVSKRVKRLDRTREQVITEHVTVKESGLYQVVIRPRDIGTLRLSNLALSSSQLIFDSSELHKKSTQTCRLEHAGQLVLTTKKPHTKPVKILDEADGVVKEIATDQASYNRPTNVALLPGIYTITSPVPLQTTGAWCTTVATSWFAPFVVDIIPSGVRDVIITRTQITAVSPGFYRLENFYTPADLAGLKEADMDYLHSPLLRLRQPFIRRLAAVEPVPARLYRFIVDY